MDHKQSKKEKTKLVSSFGPIGVVDSWLEREHLLILCIKFHFLIMGRHNYY